VGSVLCGSAAFIKTARRWRKMVGGGMRQAGILAAAGIIALTEMVERLAEDQVNARRLAEGLAGIPGFAVDMALVQTNMVFLDVDSNLVEKFVPFMTQQGIIITDMPPPIRLVTHYGIETADIEAVLQAAEKFSRQFYQN
jgi:threonine aldolase